ncbi:hypothetical protein HDU76_001522 [Blyttiomyces sp. JEL0837]|nr:hypothetical protein HDU76_001522 [Blyttiomyces sp. JEL0837]
MSVLATAALEQEAMDKRLAIQTNLGQQQQQQLESPPLSNESTVPPHGLKRAASQNLSFIWPSDSYIDMLQTDETDNSSNHATLSSNPAYVSPVSPTTKNLPVPNENPADDKGKGKRSTRQIPSHSNVPNSQPEVQIPSEPLAPISSCASTASLNSVATTIRAPEPKKRKKTSMGSGPYGKRGRPQPVLQDPLTVDLTGKSAEEISKIQVRQALNLKLKEKMAADKVREQSGGAGSSTHCASPLTGSGKKTFRPKKDSLAKGKSIAKESKQPVRVDQKKSSVRSSNESHTSEDANQSRLERHNNQVFSQGPSGMPPPQAPQQGATPFGYQMVYMPVQMPPTSNMYGIFSPPPSLMASPTYHEQTTPVLARTSTNGPFATLNSIQHPGSSAAVYQAQTAPLFHPGSVSQQAMALPHQMSLTQLFHPQLSQTQLLQQYYSPSSIVQSIPVSGCSPSGQSSSSSTVKESGVSGGVFISPTESPSTKNAATPNSFTWQSPAAQCMPYVIQQQHQLQLMCAYTQGNSILQQGQIDDQTASLGDDVMGDGNGNGNENGNNNTITDKEQSPLSDTIASGGLQLIASDNNQQQSNTVTSPTGMSSTQQPAGFAFYPHTSYPMLTSVSSADLLGSPQAALLRHGSLSYLAPFVFPPSSPTLAMSTGYPITGSDDRCNIAAGGQDQAAGSGNNSHNVNGSMCVQPSGTPIMAMGSPSSGFFQYLPIAYNTMPSGQYQFSQQQQLQGSIASNANNGNGSQQQSVVMMGWKASHSPRSGSPVADGTEGGDKADEITSSKEEKEDGKTSAAKVQPESRTESSITTTSNATSTTLPDHHHQNSKPSQKQSLKTGSVSASNVNTMLPPQNILSSHQAYPMPQGSMPIIPIIPTGAVRPGGVRGSSFSSPTTDLGLPLAFMHTSWDMSAVLGGPNNNGSNTNMRDNMTTTAAGNFTSAGTNYGHFGQFHTPYPPTSSIFSATAAQNAAVAPVGVWWSPTPAATPHPQSMMKYPFVSDTGLVSARKECGLGNQVNGSSSSVSTQKGGKKSGSTSSSETTSIGASSSSSKSSSPPAVLSSPSSGWVISSGELLGFVEGASPRLFNL